MMEVAEDFRDVHFDGEGIRVFPENFAKGILLTDVHDAEKDGNGFAAIHSAALQHGDGVAEACDQFCRQFVRFVGHDLECHSYAVFLQQVRTDSGIEETVKDAKKNGFDLFSVNEVADSGDEAIQPKGDAEKPDGRIFVSDDGGDEIDAAGIRAATAEDVVDIAHDDAADDGAEQRTCSGVGGIGE